MESEHLFLYYMRIIIDKYKYFKWIMN